MVSYACPIAGLLQGDVVMTKKTCAACDCELDATPVKVKIGMRVVEVCCEECARKLREASAKKQ
jgi:hypothetical protein